MCLDARAATNSIRSSISRIELTYIIFIVFFISNCILFPTTNKHSQNCQSYFIVPRLYLGIFHFYSFWGDNGVDSMVRHKRIASATDYLPFILAYHLGEKGYPGYIAQRVTRLTFPCFVTSLYVLFLTTFLLCLWI